MGRYSLSLAILFPTPLQITEVVFPYQPTGVILLCSTKRDISFSTRNLQWISSQETYHEDKKTNFDFIRGNFFNFNNATNQLAISARRLGC